MVDDLLGRGRVPACSAIDVDTFSRFFAEKVAKVRSITADAPAPTFTHAASGVSLGQFRPLPTDDVINSVLRLPDKSSAADPIPIDTCCMQCVLRAVAAAAAAAAAAVATAAHQQLVYECRRASHLHIVCDRRRTLMPLEVCASPTPTLQQVPTVMIAAACIAPPSFAFLLGRYAPHI